MSTTSPVMTIAAPGTPDDNKPKTPAGLQGVVAVQSEICFIDGVAGKLVYRGYDIEDLVENTTFEEVAHLLWYGELPNQSQLDNLKSQLRAAVGLPPHVVSILRALPKNTQPMDALR